MAYGGLKGVLAITGLLVLLFFVVSLLCWAYAGSAIPLNAVNLLQGTMNLSIPLVLGALAGCMCERSGVINIAIEGQLLVGAFAALAGSTPAAISALSLVYVIGLPFILMAPETAHRPLAE